MHKTRYITIMLIPDGTSERRGYRLPAWVLKAAMIAVALLVIGILLFFIFYGEVLTRAAMAERLERENHRLLRYQYKVRLLEENLVQAREVLGRLTKLAGVDYSFPEVPDDSTFFASLDGDQAVTLTRSSSIDFSIPSGLPMEGVISQEFEIGDSDRYHPGIDLAAAVGEPVLATATGVVEEAAFDSVYGWYVVLRHNDSLTTMYGHADTILVAVGQMVPVGSRIALCGSTGRSTAPHLHYEIRINDKPIDPLDSPYDQKRK
jgi:murein DD-endopeptidase MepM/ murein hydrolase activator NlpD